VIIEIGKEYIQERNPKLLPDGSKVFFRLTHLDGKNAHLLAVNDLLSVAVPLDIFKNSYVEGCE